MNIAVASSVFPHPKAGRYVGIESYVKNLSATLAQMGHQVSIITTFWNGGAREELWNDLRIYRLPDTSIKYGKLGRLFDWHYVSWGRAVTTLRELLESVDVVHAVSPLSCSKILKEMGLPLVTSVHHYTDLRTVKQLLHLPFHHRLEKFACRYSDLIIVPSSRAKSDYMESYHIDEEKFRLIPHGVDPKRFAPALRSQGFDSHDLVKLLFVGEHEPRKGLEYLLRALVIVKKHRNDFKLTMVGTGSQLPFLKALAARLDLLGYVEFLGYIGEEELVECYKRCDVFILPTLREGFGMVLLEAMACGKAVVTTDLPPIPEVVGNCGLIVRPRDEESLASAIMHLMDRPELRVELGQMGRKRVLEAFSWERTARETLSVYREACG